VRFVAQQIVCGPGRGQGAMAAKKVLFVVGRGLPEGK
jgi:hypothetical protein